MAALFAVYAVFAGMREWDVDRVSEGWHRRYEGEGMAAGVCEVDILR